MADSVAINGIVANTRAVPSVLQDVIDGEFLIMGNLGRSEDCLPDFRQYRLSEIPNVIFALFNVLTFPARLTLSAILYTRSINMR